MPLLFFLLQDNRIAIATAARWNMVPRSVRKLDRSVQRAIVHMPGAGKALADLGVQLADSRDQDGAFRRSELLDQIMTQALLATPACYHRSVQDKVRADVRAAAAKLGLNGVQV